MNILNIIICAGSLLFYSFAGVASASDDSSAKVRTSAMTKHTFTETLTGYGIITPDVGSATVINFPRAGRVSKILTTQGQLVKRGSEIIEFATDPSASQGYKQAADTLDYARKELQRAETLAAEKMATQSQLADARKVLIEAEAAFETQKKIGAGTAVEKVGAPFEGFVVSIPVAQGEIVQPGTVVMQLARTDALRVQLGIEPEDSAKIKPGMPVLLASVFNVGCPTETRVDEVMNMINPQTQLIDAVVRLKGRQCKSLFPGMRMRGIISISSRKAWAVPGNAVLADDRGAFIYQVSGGAAHRVSVVSDSENNGLKSISGKFDPRLPVVVEGNYELKDGMKVREYK
ncbi:MAG TPA: efflux RND transporter periplasmic adaptor subunit [Nitrospirota bacterium]